MKNLIIILFTALSIGLFLSGCNKHTEHMKGGACCEDSEKPVTPMVHTGNSENSIYQMGGEWVNQDNQPFQLEALKGKVQLVAMIFTHCGFACPKMVDNIKQIEQELPKELRDKVAVTLVSFDVERDNPQRLKQYAKDKDLGPEWTLLHGADDQVRVMSMLLNIQYNQLSDGSFSHSNILTVLDKDGAIVTQLEGLDIDTKNIVKAVTQTVES